MALKTPLSRMRARKKHYRKVHCNKCKQGGGSEVKIIITTTRTKSLSELTALDVPRGLDPEDVATDGE